MSGGVGTATGAADALPADAARAACQRLLGTPAGAVERPGGRDRRSLRVHCGAGTVIATCRRDPRRARLEAEVLRALSAHGAPVPRVLAFDGIWLIQEDIGRRRLAEAMADAAPADAEAWLDAALAGLTAIHRAGRAAALERRVAALGARRDWLLRLFDRAATVARQLRLPAPPLPTAALAELLRIRDPWLIKWDARLGNALIAPDGRLAWIDWEHCGCRNRLDDVAWLLCDEYVPDLPDAELRLLARHVPGFAEDWAADEAARYLAAYGTFHSLVRLSVVLDRKGRGPWWDRGQCLAADMPDVSCAGALRLCRRARRWAARTPLTVALVPWLAEVERGIAALPSGASE